MQLGSVVFDWDPDELTPPRQVKAHTSMETYSSHVLLVFDALLAGVELRAFWELIPVDQALALYELYQSGGSYTLDTDDGNTYTVEIRSADYEYEPVVLGGFEYRRNFEMILIISA